MCSDPSFWDWAGRAAIGWCVASVMMTITLCCIIDHGKRVHKRQMLALRVRAIARRK